MVRLSRVGVVAMFAASAIGLTGADSCDRDPNVKEPAQPRKACNTRPIDAPVVVRLGGQVAMKAASFSECDRAPDEHVVKVWMEFREGGTWIAQADKAGNTWGECAEIPAVITRSAANGCCSTRARTAGGGRPSWSTDVATVGRSASPRRRSRRRLSSAPRAELRRIRAWTGGTWTTTRRSRPER